MSALFAAEHNPVLGVELALLGIDPYQPTSSDNSLYSKFSSFSRKTPILRLFPISGRRSGFFYISYPS